MENRKAATEIGNRIRDLPGDLYLNTVEVIANVLMDVGIQYLQTNGHVDPNVSLAGPQLVETILDVQQKHGESLGLALAHQGLTMLIWLDTVETSEN